MCQCRLSATPCPTQREAAERAQGMYAEPETKAAATGDTSDNSRFRLTVRVRIRVRGLLSGAFLISIMLACPHSIVTSARDPVGCDCVGVEVECWWGVTVSADVGRSEAAEAEWNAIVLHQLQFVCSTVATMLYQ